MCAEPRQRGNRRGRKGYRETRGEVKVKSWGLSGVVENDGSGHRVIYLYGVLRRGTRGDETPTGDRCSPRSSWGNGSFSRLFAFLLSDFIVHAFKYINVHTCTQIDA